MKPLNKGERQYVAYYLYNIMSLDHEQVDGNHSMPAPSHRDRMTKLRLLTSVIVSLQGDDEEAENIRGRLDE